MHIYSSSHSSTADVYEGFDPAAIGGLAAPRIPLLTLPDDWEVCVGKTGQHPPAANLSCAADEGLQMPFTMGNADNAEVRFNDRYMSMKPFRYAGATYFLLSVLDVNQSNVWFIVKPLPHKHYELTCSLEFVTLHL